jgi:hypothetical protein
MAEPYFRRQQIGLAFRIPDTSVEAEGSRAAVRHAGLDLLLHAADLVPGGDLMLSVETRDHIAVLAVAATAKNGSGARDDRDEPTPGAPFAADRIARRLGGAVRATKSGETSWRWELELPRPRTPESDKENHASGTDR